MIGALAPIIRTVHIKMCTNIARSRLASRIAKRSIAFLREGQRNRLDGQVGMDQSFNVQVVLTSRLILTCLFFIYPGDCLEAIRLSELTSYQKSDRQQTVRRLVRSDNSFVFYRVNQKILRRLKACCYTKKDMRLQGLLYLHSSRFRMCTCLELSYIRLKLDITCKCPRIKQFKCFASTKFALSQTSRYI